MNAILKGSLKGRTIDFTLQDVQDISNDDLKVYRNVFETSPLVTFYEGEEFRGELEYQDKGNTLSSPDTWELAIPLPLPEGDELKDWDLPKNAIPALVLDVYTFQPSATIYSRDGDHYSGKGEAKVLVKAKVSDPRRDFGTVFYQGIKDALKVYFPNEANGGGGGGKAKETRDKKPLIERFTAKGFTLPVNHESMSYDELLDEYSIALIESRKGEG